MYIRKNGVTYVREVTEKLLTGNFQRKGLAFGRQFVFETGLIVVLELL